VKKNCGSQWDSERKINKKIKKNRRNKRLWIVKRKLKNIKKIPNWVN
jgi:hypothetical protein